MWLLKNLAKVFVLLREWGEVVLKLLVSSIILKGLHFVLFFGGGIVQNEDPQLAKINKNCKACCSCSASVKNHVCTFFK